MGVSIWSQFCYPTHSPAITESCRLDSAPAMCHYRLPHRQQRPRGPGVPAEGHAAARSAPALPYRGQYLLAVLDHLEWTASASHKLCNLLLRILFISRTAWWRSQLTLAFVLRLQDVSTVMELCRRWFPAEYNKAPRKRNAHTALSDIQDSIRQLRHYRCCCC